MILAHLSLMTPLLSAIENILLMGQEQTKATLAFHTQLLRSILERLAGAQVEPAELPAVVRLPLQTLEEVDGLEAELADETKMRQLVRYSFNLYVSCQSLTNSFWQLVVVI